MTHQLQEDIVRRFGVTYAVAEKMVKEQAAKARRKAELTKAMRRPVRAADETNFDEDPQAWRQEVQRRMQAIEIMEEGTKELKDLQKLLKRIIEAEQKLIAKKTGSVNKKEEDWWDMQHSGWAMGGREMFAQKLFNILQGLDEAKLAAYIMEKIGFKRTIPIDEDDIAPLIPMDIAPGETMPGEEPLAEEPVPEDAEGVEAMIVRGTKAGVRYDDLKQGEVYDVTVSVPGSKDPPATMSLRIGKKNPRGGYLASLVGEGSGKLHYFGLMKKGNKVWLQGAKRNYDVVDGIVASIVKADTKADIEKMGKLTSKSILTASTVRAALKLDKETENLVKELVTSGENHLRKAQKAMWRDAMKVARAEGKQALEYANLASETLPVGYRGPLSRQVTQLLDDLIEWLPKMGVVLSTASADATTLLAECKKPGIGGRANFDGVSVGKRMGKSTYVHRDYRLSDDWSTGSVVRADTKADIEKWIKAAAKHIEKITTEKDPDKAFMKKTLGFTKGKKYYRVHIESADGDGFDRSAYCFIDMEGNIYKADSWKRPARGLRGTVYNVDPNSIDPYTSWLYRRR